MELITACYTPVVNQVCQVRSGTISKLWCIRERRINLNIMKTNNLNVMNRQANIQQCGFSNVSCVYMCADILFCRNNVLQAALFAAMHENALRRMEVMQQLTVIEFSDGE